MDFEKVLAQLSEAMIVTAGIQARHEDVLKDHRKWLEEIHEFDKRLLNSLKAMEENQRLRMAEHERWMAEHEQRITEHERWKVDHERAMTDHERVLAEHGRAMAAHEQRMAAFDLKLAEMGEKLDALIVIVDGVVRDRPPKPPSS